VIQISAARPQTPNAESRSPMTLGRRGGDSPSAVAARKLRIVRLPSEGCCAQSDGHSCFPGGRAILPVYSDPSPHVWRLPASCGRTDPPLGPACRPRNGRPGLTVRHSVPGLDPPAANSTLTSCTPGGAMRRMHCLPWPIRGAARRSDITKRVTAHTFRHSFATDRVDAGSDIRTVQELLGHKDVRTTMISTHVLNRGGRGVRSPADGLAPHRNECWAGAAYHAPWGVVMTQLADARQLAANTRLRVRRQRCRLQVIRRNSL
jgi:hypothetical protein